MKEHIKSCPFCGSLRVWICRTNPRACWVRCNECGADAKSSPRRKTAIQNWNRRAADAFEAAIAYDDEAEEKANE